MNQVFTAPEPSPAASAAISSWPDVESLYQRFDALVKQPIRPIRRDALNRVMAYFDRALPRFEAPGRPWRKR